MIHFKSCLVFCPCVFLHCNHLAQGRESWSVCFSCICLFCGCLFPFLLMSGIGWDLCSIPWTFLFTFFCKMEAIFHFQLKHFLAIFLSSSHSDISYHGLSQLAFWFWRRSLKWIFKIAVVVAILDLQSK